MFNPKKWNVLCWIMLLIWLYPSVVRNTPRKPVFPKKPSLFTTAYFTGWPLTYLENSQEGFTIVSQKTFRPIYLIVNFILIMTTLFGIVFSIQTLMPKFSISTLLIVLHVLASWLLLRTLSILRGRNRSGLLSPLPALPISTRLLGL